MAKGMRAHRSTSSSASGPYPSQTLAQLYLNPSQQLYNLNGIYDLRRPYSQNLARIKRGAQGVDAPTVSYGSLGLNPPRSSRLLHMGFLLNLPRVITH